MLFMLSAFKYLPSSTRRGQSRAREGSEAHSEIPQGCPSAGLPRVDLWTSTSSAPPGAAESEALGRWQKPGSQQAPGILIPARPKCRQAKGSDGETEFSTKRLCLRPLDS